MGRSGTPGTCPVFRPRNGHNGIMSTGAGHWRACPVGRFGGRGHVRFSGPEMGMTGLCPLVRAIGGHVPWADPVPGDMSSFPRPAMGMTGLCPLVRAIGGHVPWADLAGGGHVQSSAREMGATGACPWAGCSGGPSILEQRYAFMAAARRRPWGMLIHQCQVDGTCSFLAPRQRDMLILGTQVDGTCPVVDPSSGHGGTMPNLPGHGRACPEGGANQRGGGPRHAPGRGHSCP